MALEFTNIPDRTGPAVYILSDAGVREEIELTKFGMDIDNATPDETQVVFLNVQKGDGLAIKEFYAVTVFPTVLIVQDDDTIIQGWYGQVPQLEQVVYYLGQATGTMQ